MNGMSFTKKPFIIWTLQRTGGTNLTQRLVEISELKGTQHEPFNQGRAFGHITEQWIQNHDRACLGQAVDEICRGAIIIKHCVEMVPWEVTRALVDASVRYGYGHLFLYRHEPLDRLLSLQFAKMSGIWGPGIKDKNELNDKIFARPLPVGELVDHENRCATLMSDTWKRLVATSAKPLALAYEDVYQAKNELGPAGRLLPVLRALGLSRGVEKDKEFVELVVGKGDQGTREKYRRFEGADKLEVAIRDVVRFEPLAGQYNLSVRRQFENSVVLHAAVDTLPAAINKGQPFDIGGVVVLRGGSPLDYKLRLVRENAELDVRWGIQSPRMAKNHLKSANGSHARFRVEGLCVTSNEDLELRLVDREHNSARLFQLKVFESHDLGAGGVDASEGHGCREVKETNALGNSV